MHGVAKVNDPTILCLLLVKRPWGKLDIPVVLFATATTSSMLRSASRTHLSFYATILL